MGEFPEKKTIIVPPQINLEEVKNSALASSPPSSPMTLQKASSVRYNCLCSPTTHPGSFRCRFHRNLSPGLTRNSKSVGSKLSELGSVGSELSEIDRKPSRVFDQLHAQ